VSAAVMTSPKKETPADGDGGLGRPGPQLAERIKLSLFTLRWWEKVLVLCFFHITFRLISFR